MLLWRKLSKLSLFNKKDTSIKYEAKIILGEEITN